MTPAGLSSLWSERWGRTSPIGWTLRTCLPERWIRFHSLPESKRYAQDEAEHLEVLRRHHAVLEALGASIETRVLTVTIQFESGEMAGVHPDAWHWRTIHPEDEDQEGSWRLFVNEGPLSALSPLLRLVANDECRGVLILPLDLAWIVHPYDEGADVITATSAERDVLAARFASWRSARPDGL